MATEDAPANDIETPGSLLELPSISLVDHTASPTDEPSTPDVELSRAGSKISKTLTHGSIRQTLARRKYQQAKWQEGKGSQSGIRYTPGEAATPDGSGITPDQPRPASTKSFDQDGSDGDTWGKGPVRRSGQKLKDAIRAPKMRSSKPHIHDPGSHIDILYENQRGFFFMGIPRFSSNSLLNFDPGAWLDSRYRPSAVNITNAQVPDPSWEWAWRCWYVDMSGDVDEEGWEYSFWFGKGCAWHGTHPWFHSFVRRRRWLRKRSKRKAFKPKEASHALTSDYFTIHSTIRPSGDDAESMGTSEKKALHSVPTSSTWGARSWEEQTADTIEVNNIADLLRGLRTAAIDREKMVLVRKFLDQGGVELHYLAENMEHIMKLLVFQNSRRQLLSMLMHEFDAAEQHRDEHQKRDEAESEEEKQHIDNLLKAVEAADDQCKQLEYWSDVREMARDGEILKAADHAHGWSHGWQGLDANGAEKQGGSPTDSIGEGEKPSEKKDKGKQPARVTDDTDGPTGWSDGSADAKSTDINRHEETVPRSSIDSSRRDVFYSPGEEKTQDQTMRPIANILTPRQQAKMPPPSLESNSSLDVYESAHSEPEEDNHDDEATERAPSEDEGDFEDTPPTGTTPIEAIAKAFDGDTTPTDKGTTSQQSKEESSDVD